jgi:ligand-binding SRPBCC domain-containing protein
VDHTLLRTQVLPIPIAQAWSFFSDPKNLAAITPPYMGFSIEKGSGQQPMHEGQLIHYKVKPLLGVPLAWTTRITAVEEPHRFVDTQLNGPYARWWHEHTFTAIPGGVSMTDKVEYRLPLGWVGAVAHLLFVRRKLEAIFAFRYETLKELFPMP